MLKYIQKNKDEVLFEFESDTISVQCFKLESYAETHMKVMFQHYIGFNNTISFPGVRFFDKHNISLFGEHEQKNVVWSFPKTLIDEGFKKMSLNRSSTLTILMIFLLMVSLVSLL